MGFGKRIRIKSRTNMRGAGDEMVIAHLENSYDDWQSEVSNLSAEERN